MVVAACENACAFVAFTGAFVALTRWLWRWQLVKLYSSRVGFGGGSL
jgi:predicted membrane-bound mannosyltransferase